ncbi:histidine kinase [Streptomyces sp. enrichment culture]|uniref:sensor histidine kinase n=1 Tax=Streptomyces sp. enrichment culture TaxID=1795815 RepID=UPI003F557E18
MNPEPKPARPAATSAGPESTGTPDSAPGTAADPAVGPVPDPAAEPAPLGGREPVAEPAFDPSTGEPRPSLPPPLVPSFLPSLLPSVVTSLPGRVRDRLLPALLFCAQAVVWPGAALLGGTVPSASALLVAVLAGGVVTAALALRRSRPVVALVVVAAACALGAGPLPAGATVVLGSAGVALALFAVAAGRDTFTAVLSVVTLAVWQLLYGVSLHRISDRNGLDLVLTALLYAAACGAGLLVRRRRRARRAAERRLTRAEAERHRLPAAERRRMERELHDVSAHHLTAVVVTAGAALGLRERRPELAREALDFAAETGREVTRALGAVRAPAPSREDAPSPEERLLELVAGFRRLGQEVDCTIDPLPDGALADAAYGIVREALTNVARYAPGARTTVRVRYGDTGTDVVVTSTAPPAGVTAHGAGLGGGRGQGFLRARAREAGGTLSTGPTADGGWEVRAALPGRTDAVAERSVPREYRAAQLTVAGGLLVQPLLPVLVIRAEDVPSGAGISAGLLFALLAAAQSVALLWLRRAPRAALGALSALALLWPVAMATGHYTGPVVLPLAVSLLPTCVALAARAADAARGAAGGGTPGAVRVADTPLPRSATPAAPARIGGRTGRTGPVAAVAAHTAAVAAVTAHTAAAVVAVLDRGTAPVRDALPVTRDLPAPVLVALVALAAAVLVALPVTGALRAGAAHGRRDRAERGHREERLAGWTEEAVRDAWAERSRIAAGLETTVFSRTADMITEAEAGRLEETVERAREALAAMRALLDTVRQDETGRDLRPQPTLQALDLLAQQLRATGRDVGIRLAERVPARLPTAVDLTAYHVAETLLAAGGEEQEEPALLDIDADEHALTLTATGMPAVADAAVRDRLSPRVSALGGTLSSGPPGTVRVRLPLTTAADEEKGER